MHRILSCAGVLLIVFVIFALSSSATLAAEPPLPDTGYTCDGGDGVYLYEDINYGGACIRFTADDPEFGDDGWHDRASSIKFVGFMYAGGRARAMLYEHAYYSGASTTFSGDDAWLGNDPIGNDSADSIRIEMVPFCNLVSQIPKAECEALVALYTTTWGAYWTNRTGWVANYNPCSWYGVTCAGGHVISLDLHENSLTGSIPSTLGNLASLQYLSLYGNQLTGSIPSTLGNLSTLFSMNLWSNQLTGPIPSSLGSLSNLTFLALFDNQLTGDIPTSLGSLSNLEELFLNDNGLTGNIPSTLGSLSNLRRLNLWSNQLTGSIPSTLGNLSNLQELYLTNNPLSDALPQSLKNLSPNYFWFDNTNLCEPPDAAFQAWLASIPDLRRTDVKCAAGSVTPTPTLTRTRTPTRTPTRAAQKRAWLPIVMKEYRAFGDDNFSATTLDARWWWVNPDPAKWSLTARPGFLRILTSSGGVNSKNLALQNAPLGDYTVQTRLLFTPTSNYQIAGIVIYRDSANYLMLGRCYCNTAPPTCRGNGIYFDHIEGGAGVGSNFAMSTTKTGEAYLRLVKRGSTYTAYYSESGTTWTLVGAHTVGVVLPYVGLTTGQDVSNARIPADFDYFDISPPTN